MPEGFADEHEHQDNFDFLPEQRGPSKLDTDGSNSESELSSVPEGPADEHEH